MDTYMEMNRWMIGGQMAGCMEINRLKMDRQIHTYMRYIDDGKMDTYIKKNR